MHYEMTLMKTTILKIFYQDSFLKGQSHIVERKEICLPVTESLTKTTNIYDYNTVLTFFYIVEQQQAWRTRKQSRVKPQSQWPRSTLEARNEVLYKYVTGNH